MQEPLAYASSCGIRSLSLQRKLRGEYSPCIGTSVKKISHWRITNTIRPDTKTRAVVLFHDSSLFAFLWRPFRTATRTNFEAASHKSILSVCFSWAKCMNDQIVDQAWFSNSLGIVFFLRLFILKEKITFNGIVPECSRCPRLLF
jgi:hypothetical protein